jgi:hypothetical protein
LYVIGGYESAGKKRERRFLVDPAEAAVVRRIFEDFTFSYPRGTSLLKMPAKRAVSSLTAAAKVT